MFDGFSTHDLTVDYGVQLHYRVGGQGPALLLLHGHPQTHVMWHHVAPRLAQHYTVVVPDLRGYGDSSRPAPGDDYIAYAKRTMAQDMATLMQHLGHDVFAVGAHDRGARVAHRLALDHPARVRKLLLLDIAPTLDMYEQTSQEFATLYWHWFFYIQPAPLPELFMEADPVGLLRQYMGRRHAGLSIFTPEAMAEYERCFALPGTAAAIANDYRASAGIDLVHDRADRAAGRRLTMPLKILWGKHGAVGRCFDVLTLWQQASDSDVSGIALDCGHYLAEEAPVVVADEMLAFFGR